MAKFIEVHDYRELRLINLDQVEEVRCKEGDRCYICMAYGAGNTQDYISPIESYDEVRKMIAQAQGGIPM